MGKVNALTHLFNAGIVSRAALNRVDKEVIRLHAERQENLIPYSIGKAIMRPGLEMLAGSLNGLRPRLLPFVKGLGDAAMLELVDGGLRVWLDDEPIERPAVTAAITNGDFSSSTGWTETETGGATATIADDVLTLAAPARGGKATVEQQIMINETGIEHALRVNVLNGPVTLRVGASQGGDEYIQESSLGTGIHSLAFTPTGIASIDDLTVLLLSFDGVDGSTAITDSSQYGTTAGVVSGAQIDTANAKFGVSSCLFQGTNDGVQVTSNRSSFAFGSTDFTIDFWVYPQSVGSGNYSLYDASPLGALSGPYVVLYISTGARFVLRVGDDTIIQSGSIATSNAWQHVAVARASGITRLFINGTLVGSAADATVYENGSNRPMFGTSGAIPSEPTSGLFGWMDEIRISSGIARWTSSFTPPSSAYSPLGDSAYIQLFSTQERAVTVESIEVESSGKMVLPGPWTEVDLPLIRVDQSGDVIFMASGAWCPRTIERRAAHSWSVVSYLPEDGPFTISRTSNARIKPNGTHGNITMSSDAPLFRPEHVGTMFLIDHERMDAEWKLGGEGVATDAWRLRGIGTENDFVVTIGGTFVATYNLQRSFEGEDSGFVDVSTGTATGSTTVSNGSEYDNQIFWSRYTIKDGNYTSGSMTVGIEYGGFGGSGIARVTGYNSSTSVEAEVLADFHDTVYSKVWAEGDWSDRRGWPEAVGFFDGRLWWARRDKFWGSESDDYYAFNLDTEGDSGSIQRNIASGGFTNQTQWIMGLQRLILGTNAAPISARSSSFDEPLTPTNVTMKPAANDGAARISPVVVGSRGIFVCSDLRRIFELGYNVDAQDYVATDLLRINEDFSEAENPDLYSDYWTELGYQSNPAPYLWALREDGIAGVMLFNPAEEARACFKLATGRIGSLDSARTADRIISVTAVPQVGEDAVYLGVERLIGDGLGGTTTAYYIEKLAYHHQAVSKVFDVSTQGAVAKNGLRMADSFILATGLGGIGQVITGLSHLEGRQVIIIGQQVDGGFGPTGTLYTVVGGQIATEEAVEGDICVGLPYEGFYKSAKLAFAGQAGTALIQKKRIEHFGLALLDTHPRGILIGQSFEEDEMSALPEIDGDGLARGDVTLFDRAVEEEIGAFPGHWDTDARVHIKIKAGYSAGLSAMLIGIETKER
jgi:hypothetical protein